MGTYFELGLNLAIKRYDFITALTFTSNKGFHQEIILDIIMDNNDLLKLGWTNKFNLNKGLLRLIKQI